MEKLQINSSDGFLHLRDLPHNCIFNKVVTGSGGTTVVLSNSEDYVIAVPTTELIINKTGRTDAGLSLFKSEERSQHIFGLFGKFNSQVASDLNSYLESKGTKKIMCTYDKVPRILDFIEPKDYRLLIDEYHCLLKAYSYRQKAIDGVLDNFRRFKSFCFMSATPILPSFKPSCLADVREIQADWGNSLDKLTVELQQTNKPYSLAANIINAYKRDGFITSKEGVRSYEAFFFINSVTDIVAILKHCKLSNDEVRIICANTPENQEKLIGYDISNSRSPNKMFNFITSKSFEGADYFSETGLCFVVSTQSNPHTLASIDTDIPQIAGRIRTKSNPFRNFIVHIFNTTYKKLNLNMTYKEMEAKTNEALDTARETIDLFNSAKNQKVKDNLRDKLKHDLNKLYMSYDSINDKFILNDMLPKLELYNFQVNEVVYKSGLSIKKSFEDNGIETISAEYVRADDTISTKKLSFKDAFLQYADIICEDRFSPQLFAIEQEQPLVKEAYHKLGIERVRGMRYIKKSVENALTSLETDKTADQRLAKMIINSIEAPATITVAKANSIIEESYLHLAIKHNAKAKELHKWFECSDPISKRVDGKVIKVVEIYRPKIIFNS